MRHSLLSLKLLALALNPLDTLSDIRIKAFTPPITIPSLAYLVLLLLL